MNRVWANDSVTIAFNQSGQLDLFVGQTKVDCIEKMELNLSAVGPEFVVHLDRERDLKDLEETTRVLNSYPWVVIR